MKLRKEPQPTYVPRHARAGNIGEEPREIEYEPLEAPAIAPAMPEPVAAPVDVPELEPVPA